MANKILNRICIWEKSEGLITFLMLIRLFQSPKLEPFGLGRTRNAPYNFSIL